MQRSSHPAGALWGRKIRIPPLWRNRNPGIRIWLRVRACNAATFGRLPSSPKVIT
jgi:hypothetical protein